MKHRLKYKGLAKELRRANAMRKYAETKPTLEQWLNVAEGSHETRTATQHHRVADSWIPVSERLPSREQREFMHAWVCYADGFVTTRIVFPLHMKDTNPFGDSHIGDIIAWKPYHDGDATPEPYVSKVKREWTPVTKDFDLDPFYDKDVWVCCAGGEILTDHCLPNVRWTGFVVTAIMLRYPKDDFPEPYQPPVRIWIPLPSGGLPTYAEFSAGIWAQWDTTTVVSDGGYYHPLTETEFNVGRTLAMQRWIAWMPRIGGEPAPLPYKPEAK